MPQDIRKAFIAAICSNVLSYVTAGEFCNSTICIKDTRVDKAV